MKELVSTTVQINAEQYANVDGYVHYHVDRFYGSDADGNRGESRTFVDDVTDVGIYDEEGNDLKVPENIRERAEKSLVTKFMES
jgi:hypothetical protein